MSSTVNFLEILRLILNEKCKNVYYRFDFESTFRILKQVLQLNLGLKTR